MKTVKMTNITTGEVYYKTCTDIEAHHVIVAFRKMYRGCHFEVKETLIGSIRKGAIRRLMALNLYREIAIRVIEIENVMIPA